MLLKKFEIKLRIKASDRVSGLTPNSKKLGNSHHQLFKLLADF